MSFRKHFHQSLTPPPEGARRACQRPLGRFGHQREPKRAPARSQHPLGCPRTPATRAGRTGETPPSAASRHTAQCSHSAMASTMVLSHRDTADGSLQAPNCCAARPTGRPGALRLNDCHPVAQPPQTTQPLSVPRDLLGTARNSLTPPPPQTVHHVNLWIPNILPEGSSSHDARLHGGRDAVPTPPHHRDRQLPSHVYT